MISPKNRRPDSACSLANGYHPSGAGRAQVLPSHTLGLEPRQPLERLSSHGDHAIPMLGIIVEHLLIVGRYYKLVSDTTTRGDVLLTGILCTDVGHNLGSTLDVDFHACTL